MKTTAKRTTHLRRAAQSERTVVYRGIKIAPIVGKRSATAKALQDALRANSERARGELAHA